MEVLGVFFFVSALVMLIIWIRCQKSKCKHEWGKWQRRNWYFQCRRCEKCGWTQEKPL